MKQSGVHSVFLNMKKDLGWDVQTDPLLRVTHWINGNLITTLTICVFKKMPKEPDGWASSKLL